MGPRLNPNIEVVYVAGAYSDPDVIQVFRNMGRGIDVCTELLKRGYAPFCPWLDYHLVMKGGVTIDQIKNYSMKFLRRCDCVVLIPGWENSEGTKAELREARRLGLLIYGSLQAFLHDKTVIDQELDRVFGDKCEIKESAK